MEWVKEGVNFWDNPDCPKEYLEGALIRLVNEVEGETLPMNYFEAYSEAEIRREVGFYEYVADK